MTDNLILGAIVTGPLLYILVTLFSKPAKSTTEYEFGARCLNPSDVLDSSIMYALQVAAVALFSTWGYLYGFVAAVVPAFWMVGYVAMAKVLPDRFLKKFAGDDNFRTLHAYVSDSSKSRLVCVVAALLTIVGLAGPAMFEAFTMGRILAATSPTIGPIGGTGMALAFLMVAAIYMTRGGFPGVVRLDQLQLAIGYGGFSLAFSLSLNYFSNTIGGSTAFSIALICFISSLAFAIFKFYNQYIVSRYVKEINEQAALMDSHDILGWIACGLGASSFLFAMISVDSTPTQTSWNIFTFIQFNSAFGFTALATISLFVANAFYQFVDVTQWQRLLSIAVNRENLPSAVKIFRMNILAGGACSSITWLIAVSFGVFLKHLFPAQETDAFAILSIFMGEIAKGADVPSAVIGFTFIVSLLAVMFSTLDSLVAGTSFTVQNDLLPVMLRNSKEFGLLAARLATVCVMCLQLAFYLSVSELAGDRVDAVLYVCWSFQLAMFPVVIGLVIGRSGSYFTRVASMVAGSAGAIAPFVFGAPEKVYEYSPWLTVLMASLVYFVLGGFKLSITIEAPVLGGVASDQTGK